MLGHNDCCLDLIVGSMQWEACLDSSMPVVLTLKIIPNQLMAVYSEG